MDVVAFSTLGVAAEKHHREVILEGLCIVIGQRNLAFQ